MQTQLSTHTLTLRIEMLEKRLVHITPAEAFKAKYNQAMNPIYLDVRSEADYNLYHIEDAVNVPLDRLEEVVPVLLSEPPANSVFIVMGNDEAAATQAWKVLVGTACKIHTSSKAESTTGSHFLARMIKRFNPTRMLVTTNWAISSLRHMAAATNLARPIP